MAGFPGFNTIDNAPEFTDDTQLAYEKMFYGMTSQFANIHDGYLGKAHTTPIVFGSGNNQTLPFAPQGGFEERNITYNAVTAYTASATRAARKSWARTLGQPLLRLRSLPIPISIPGAGFLVSLLGASAPAKSVLSKRRRCVCGACDECNGLCGGEWAIEGYGVGQPVKNATNANMHEYVRPARKVRFYGVFQPGEDGSWTVDPRTGRRIPVMRV